MYFAFTIFLTILIYLHFLEVLWAPSSISIPGTVCPFLALSLPFCVWHASMGPFIPLLSCVRQWPYLPKLSLTVLCMLGNLWDPLLSIPSPTPRHKTEHVTARHSAEWMSRDFMVNPVFSPPPSSSTAMAFSFHPREDSFCLWLFQ